MDRSELPEDRFFGGDPPCWGHLLDEDGRLGPADLAQRHVAQAETDHADVVTPAERDRPPESRDIGTGRPEAPPHL